MQEDEKSILAKTIYGEARGEGLPGMEAIAMVVLNRVKFAKNKGGYWWGSTIREVCLKPWQFSCWNKDDPNFRLLQTITEKNEVFAVCSRISSRAVCGFLKDITSGATHYHTKSTNPKWAFGKIPCFELKSHLFYNDIEKE